MGGVIDEPARLRLNRIAGLLASPHDGEVLNAARMLVRSMQGAGLRPEEMFPAFPLGRSRMDERISDWIDEAMAKARTPAPVAAHAAEIDELLDLRWRMSLTKKSERLLHILKRQASLTDDERSWLDDLRRKLDRLRYREVVDARANMTEDFA